MQILWHLFSELTVGDWPIDLVALGAVLGAAGWMWRYVLSPFGRAFWAAITAAPRLVTAADTLIGLLEGEVLVRIDEASKRVEHLATGALAFDVRLADHEARIILLERASAPKEQP